MLKIFRKNLTEESAMFISTCVCLLPFTCYPSAIWFCLLTVSGNFFLLRSPVFPCCRSPQVHFHSCLIWLIFGIWQFSSSYLLLLLTSVLGFLPNSTYFFSMPFASVFSSPCHLNAGVHHGPDLSPPWSMYNLMQSESSYYTSMLMTQEFPPPVENSFRKLSLIFNHRPGIFTWMPLEHIKSSIHSNWNHLLCLTPSPSKPYCGRQNNDLPNMSTS